MSGRALRRYGLVAGGVFVACAQTTPSSPTMPNALGSEAGAPPTYHADVAPILEAKCTGCHIEGGSGPFALTNYDAAYARRDLIKLVTQERRMPPGPHPLRDDCAEYVQERHLTTRELATLARWADDGGRAGAPVARAPRTRPVLRTDTSIKLPLAYTPRFDATRHDDYRCFVLDWKENRERFVTGFRARPTVTHEVHHAIAFLIEPEAADGYIAADAADPEPGYPCFGAPGGGNFTSLGSWSPGADGDVMYPAGTGLRVRSGSKVVVQMHYNALGGSAEPDETAFEFQLDDNVRPALFLLHANPRWIVPDGMPIRAGDPDARVRYTVDLTNGEPFTVYNAGVHMHLLGKRAGLAIERANGTSECLIDSSHDFAHQGGYVFAEPRRVAPGDKIALECAWDNSAANQPVIDGRRRSPKDASWGEGTEDEMCVMAMYIVRGEP